MKIRSTILAVLFVAALFAIKLIFFPSEKSASMTPMKGKPMPSNVTAFVLKTEKLSNEVYSSGTILANEEVQLQSELSGKIIQLNFKEGSKVTKGQLLVKINDADLQAQYRRLKLQVELADQKTQRQKQLLAINGTSQQDYDISLNEYNVLKADLDYAMSQIEKTEIKAPFDGIIGLKNISIGAYITPSIVIARIQQINPTKIDFSIGERYASLVKKGDKVLFSIDGNQKKLEGEVFAVEPKINLDTRTLQVRAICDNKEGHIYPGAFARVQLSLGDIDHALMIPTESVIPDLKGKKVFIIKNGAVDFARIETGLRTDSKIQVTNGLSVGDTIVSTGIMQLKPGSQVKITQLK